MIFPDVGPCREAKNIVLLPIIHAFQKNNFGHHSSKVQIEHKGKLYVHRDSSETKNDGKYRKNLSLQKCQVRLWPLIQVFRNKSMLHL